MNTVKVNNMRPQVSLRSQKGQMAIFLVLIFQVLFVFFAMTINVGLVVYDKITLQNATDIAAYYAAQKQAELLNEIAHVNYQMRQAYKLLTFRVRVIGSLSVGIGVNSSLPPHPIFVGPAMGQEQTPFFDRMGGGRRPPSVCMGSSLWQEYKKIDPNATVSLCRDLTGFSAPPTTGGGGGILSGVIDSLDGFITTIQQSIEARCKQVGVLNWQLAASFLQAYTQESVKRSGMIDKLATNMSLPANEMLDFRGESVLAGTRKTLEKNLTDPQVGTLEMTLINSLSPDVSGPCSDPKYWLPKINIYPIVTYVRMVWNNLRCSNQVVGNRSAAGLPPSNYMNLAGGRGNELIPVWTNNQPTTMGYEKNPWCMPYMGVKATTRPRKIFAPFGTPVELKAESYAKPFGGRMGPWYFSSWSSGSKVSDGSTRVDPLLPARDVDGTATNSDPADDMVNFSKYPGDTLGMNSQFALGAMAAFWKTLVPTPTSVPAVFALQHYNHIGQGADFESTGNSLVQDNGLSGPSSKPIRQMEEAAMAPDLFDVLYYSVETQFVYNYFNKQESNFQSYLMGGEYYLDLGALNRDNYSIVDQMKETMALYASNVPFYMATNPAQALTGWAQQSANDYSFPDKFAKCDKRMDDNPSDIESYPSPGGCPFGGRSGHSVKIVSKKYLMNLSEDLGLGGSAGSILNKPPDNN